MKDQFKEQRIKYNQSEQERLYHLSGSNLFDRIVVEKKEDDYYYKYTAMLILNAKAIHYKPTYERNFTIDDLVHLQLKQQLMLLVYVDLQSIVEDLGYEAKKSEKADIAAIDKLLADARQIMMKGRKEVNNQPTQQEQG